MWRLRGIHGIPPETPVVPPIRAAFSSRTTSAPPSDASVAAASPAAPEPRTTTSATRSQRSGRLVIIPHPLCREGSYGAPASALGGAVQRGGVGADDRFRGGRGQRLDEPRKARAPRRRVVWVWVVGCPYERP